MEQRKEAGYDLKNSSHKVKVDLAEMLKGGLIVDVADEAQAQVAQEAGAIAVVATDPAAVGAPMRWMSNPESIKSIQEAVSIPVIAKCRIGHSVEAQILEALFVDFIDESEELPPVDIDHYIDKHAYRIPFVCGCADLGEALRRIAEGASLLKVTGGRSSNDIAVTIQNMRGIFRQIRYLSAMDRSELLIEAKRMGAVYTLVEEVADTGQLPIPLFAEGGISTPADAALLMQLGAQSVFVENTIFSQINSVAALKALAAAIAHYNDPETLSKISRGQLCEMQSSESCSLENDDAMLPRGW